MSRRSREVIWIVRETGKVMRSTESSGDARRGQKRPGKATKGQRKARRGQERSEWPAGEVRKRWYGIIVR